MSQPDPFSPHIAATARHFFGDPNAALSSRDELRFGEHGSMSVDVAKGTFFDHENKVGGGVIDLVKREAKCDGREAVRYLRETVGARLDLDEAPQSKAKKIVATYDYFDDEGELLFQVVRFEPKDFRQRRPDPKAADGWNWSVRGVRQVPYRLPELIEAMGEGRTLYVVEGEKDADALWRRGIPATCNAGGAGKWPAEFAPHFKAADVVILPDNDDAGRNHRDIVASSLQGVAARVRVLDLPGLPPKGDVSDWLTNNGSADMLIDITGIMSVTWGPKPPPSRFGAIHWADIDRVAIRQDWLVQDMMFCGDAGLMFGASGSGKSFLTVELGLSISRGVPFLGKATRKGGVIYQAGEGGKGLVKRLRAYKQHHSVIGDASFVLLPARADFFAQDGDCEAFIEECLAQQAAMPEPLALVVIDTLSTASPGANENASEDMSRLLRFSERLQKSTAAAVLWVHHKNAAGDRERGHTSLRANVDTALEVIRDDETQTRTLRVVKLKDGEDGEKIGFELQSVQIGTYDDGKPMTSCVVRPAQVGDAQAGLKKTRLAAGPAKFLKILDDAILHRGGQLPAGERIPSNMSGVEWGQFRDFYVLWHGDTDQDAIRQALKRDAAKLYTDGLIDRRDPWIWITDRGRRALK